jgi:serine/threonine protein kinase
VIFDWVKVRHLEDILTVLAFVHEQNIIHRDIKPANLMRRNEDAEIILIDFGAVKHCMMHSGLKTLRINSLVATSQSTISSAYRTLERIDFTSWRCSYPAGM